MATTDTSPRVDIGALIGELRSEAVDWLKEALADHFASDQQLSERQKVNIVSTLVDRDDELELAIARRLHKELTSYGVQRWGLPVRHALSVLRARTSRKLVICDRSNVDR